jgi:glutamate-5-semialdehyde dehydrogenase
MTKETLITQLKACKVSVGVLAQLSAEKKRQTLLTLVSILTAEKQKILTANKQDIARAIYDGKSEAFIDRLTFSDKTYASMLNQLQAIAESPEFLHEVLEEKVLANGVRLQKLRVPLGVVAVVYESRPNVTIDVFALCFMSGNVSVLKGGSDAIHTNRILAGCIHQALQKHGISDNVSLFLDTTQRRIVSWLIKERAYIDVIVPRGGYTLVAKIADEAKIPVLYHASGGARIYVDESADLSMALSICVNAKTNRPATCNSVDTIVVHESLAHKFLPLLIEKLWEHDVKIYGDEKTREIVSLHVESADAEDYDTEFLDYVVAIKIVSDADEAIQFIATHTTHHSEGIVSKDKAVIARFVSTVDAAGVFVNCSTRLHDGGIFGLGAEIGVATGKLHARGPVGLRELMTYKWVAYGKGQVRE